MSVQIIYVRIVKPISCLSWSVTKIQLLLGCLQEANASSGKGFCQYQTVIIPFTIDDFDSKHIGIVLKYFNIDIKL